MDNMTWQTPNTEEPHQHLSWQDIRGIDSPKDKNGYLHQPLTKYKETCSYNPNHHSLSKKSLTFPLLHKHCYGPLLPLNSHSRHPKTLNVSTSTETHTHPQHPNTRIPPAYHTIPSNQSNEDESSCRQHPGGSEQRGCSWTNRGAEAQENERSLNDHPQRLHPTEWGSPNLNSNNRQFNSCTQAYCESKVHCNITQMIGGPSPNTAYIICYIASLDNSIAKSRSCIKHSNIRKIENN